MAISFEQMQQLLQNQQKQFEESQKRLVEMMSQKLNLKSESVSVTNQPSVDAIAASISEFVFDAVSGVTFESWFQKYEDVFRLELAKQEDSWRVRLLLRKLGAVEHERYSNFVLPKNPREFSFDQTVQTLTQIFGEQASLFSTRYNCLKLTKSDSHDFVTHAGIVNKECERFKLATMTPDQLKSLVFVCSLQSHSDADIRTRILHKLEQEPDMTLQAITTECQRLINLKHDTRMIEKSGQQQEPQVCRTVAKHPNSHEADRNQKPPSACWQCGDWHFSKFCPFKKHQCHKCKRIGHKETHCRAEIRSKRVYPINPNRQSRPNRTRRPWVNTRAILSTFRTDFVSNRKYLTLTVNGIPLVLQIDTASDITIVSRDTWIKLGRPSIKPTDLVAQNASGHPMKIDGETECDVRFRCSRFPGTLYVTPSAKINLLGMDWIEAMNLLDVPLNEVCTQPDANVNQTAVPTFVRKTSTEQLCSRYADIFGPTLGHCAKMQATLTLLPDAKPVFRPRRPVPYASQNLVDGELDRLQRAGVIEQIKFSPWATPIVVIKKPNGTIRLCADFSTGLNAALEPHEYPLPLPEDLFAKLNGGKYFATLDLAEAYLQLEVEPESRKLLTINTHRGLYQYNRLPFGVKTAPAIFQQVMDTMLSGVPGVAAYLDDIIVMGGTENELHHRLEEVMKRIRDYGFHLRADKCKFLMKSIKFLGFVIDQHGRRPDAENIEVIDRLPAPTDITSLRSFLGMISHYSEFLPEMHRLRYPLNQLLVKDVDWNWSRQCQQTFDKLKSLLKSDLLLTHYNPELEIILATDASSYGIGAVISHRFPDGSEKAVAHAARALTMTERNYSQIEKEALAIVFSVQKFHKMLYGRRFTLLTDHKPLLAIFGSKKGIPTYTASRLQRWATLLLGYDFQMKYISTDSIGQADALSRLINTGKREPEDAVIAAMKKEPDVSLVLQDAVRSLPVTARMVQEETKRDETLQEVLRYIRNGWPKNCPKKELIQFFTRRGSLSEIDSCLFFAERIIVPEVLRQRVLRQLHKGHPGISRMKALARSYVFWPMMDSQLEEVGRSCSNCACASKRPIKTELQTWPIPDSPWSRIHVDFAGPINGVSFLILIDAYSKWPEVVVMPNTSASSTIRALRHVFSHHGYPENLISDNGPQFTSSLFTDFCDMNGVKHTRTAPYHPQSNGQAERFVDTMKRALAKSMGEGTLEERLECFLLNYRVTPNPNAPDGKSPSELLMGRRLRTTLDLMIPKHPVAPVRNRKMEYQYNRHHGAQKKRFNVGEPVFALAYGNNRTSWQPGYVSRRRGTVLYDVEVGNQRWIRHANQLRRRTTSVHSSLNATQLSLNQLMQIDESRPPDTWNTRKYDTIQHETKLRPKRKRKFVQPFQVNPKYKNYEYPR